MLPTLQWYIFREMGKTFLLTAVGLTVVIGLGGGAMNLLDIERVTPSQLLRLMLLVLPVAGTLTIPIAALYSATVTYGRLSADNEFLACRASGINVLRLFFPTAIISLFSAACTFYFTCFMIPGLIRDLNTFARTGIRQFVQQQVSSPQRLALPGGRYRIYADGADRSEDGEAVVLRGFAFVKHGPQSWDAVGTGGGIVIRFESDERDDAPLLSADLYDVTYYDWRDGRWLQAEHQQARPNRIPMRIRQRVKWLNLAELFRLRGEPENWPRVRSVLNKLRGEIAKGRYCASVQEQFDRQGSLKLVTADGTIQLQAQTCYRDTVREDAVKFEHLSVTDERHSIARSVTGEQAHLWVESDDDGRLTQAILEITGEVAVREQGLGTQPMRKARERFGDIAVPEDLRASMAEVPHDELLHLPPEPNWLSTIFDLRAEATEEQAGFVREVTSELHSRLAFSVSAFVLVLLGATLGTMLRGSQIMSAFGISFVPALLVTVMNIMGRQLAEKAGLSTVGIAVIWGTIGLVGMIDIWTLRRVIRR